MEKICPRTNDIQTTYLNSVISKPNIKVRGNRNQVLDIAKGLLIILVVFGHSIQYGFGDVYCNTEQFFDNIFFRCIYIFHMPLFMLISGYLFYYTNNKAYWKIITSRLIAIGIPFVMYFNIIYIVSLYCTPYPSHFYFSHYFLAFKGTMWFLSSILLNCIIVSSVTHFFKNRIKIGYVILWLLFALTFIIPDSYIPALHKYMYPYFLLGFCFNHYYIKIPRYYWSKWTFLGLTVFTLICSFCYGKTIFIYNAGFSIYENGVIDYEKLIINLIRFIMGLGSSCWFMRIIFYIKHHIRRLVPFLIHIGQETLGIYGFQSIIFATLSAIMSIKGINFQTNIMPFFVCTIVLVLCEILIRFCDSNRYTRLLFLGKLSTLR